MSFTIDNDKSGADAVQDKLKRLLIERAELKDRWRANTSALKDAVAAGRLFGVKIDLPADVDQSTSHLLPESQVAYQETQGSRFKRSAELTIREAVLDQLRIAGETGMKALTLRRVIEKTIGHSIHYKTVGMTLYRLSEKGLVRREKLIWFSVPDRHETKAPALTTPGLKESQSGGAKGEDRPKA
jgi:hypothetical protein